MEKTSDMEHYVDMVAYACAYVRQRPHVVEYLEAIYGKESLWDEPVHKIINAVSRNERLFLYCAENTNCYGHLEEALDDVNAYYDSNSPVIVVVHVAGIYVALTKNDMWRLADWLKSLRYKSITARAYYGLEWPQKCYLVCQTALADDMISIVRTITNGPVYGIADGAGETQITIDEIYPNAGAARRAAKQVLQQVASYYPAWTTEICPLAPRSVSGKIYHVPLINLADE